MTLTDGQVHFYHDRGYLRIPGVYGAEELAALRDDLDWMIEAWANRTPGCSGPWRQAYMDERTDPTGQDLPRGALRSRRRDGPQAAQASFGHREVAPVGSGRGGLRGSACVARIQGLRASSLRLR